jgi:hypothetical protein
VKHLFSAMTGFLVTPLSLVHLRFIPNSSSFAVVSGVRSDTEVRDVGGVLNPFVRRKEMMDRRTKSTPKLCVSGCATPQITR